MEGPMAQMISQWLKQKDNRKFTKALKIFLIYFILLQIAKHTYVFHSGFLPGDLLDIVILIAVMFYRLLTILFAPILLILWVADKYFN
jgi:hypothetical protein